jgi:hypothetical protein
LLNVHHDGTLTVELTWMDRDTEPLIEVYRASGGQPSGRAIQSGGDGLRQQFSANLDAHEQYIIHVRKFGQGGGPPPAAITPFRLTVTRAN